MALPQQHEFSAWGLSKLMVRNIVVAFIVCLLTAVSSLFAVIIKLDDQQRTDRAEWQAEIARFREENAKKIEALKNEQLDIMRKYGESLSRERELREALYLERAKRKGR